MIVCMVGRISLLIGVNRDLNRIKKRESIQLDRHNHATKKMIAQMSGNPFLLNYKPVHQISIKAESIKDLPYVILSESNKIRGDLDVRTINMPTCQDKKEIFINAKAR